MIILILQVNACVSLQAVSPTTHDPIPFIKIPSNTLVASDYGMTFTLYPGKSFLLDLGTDVYD